MLSDGFWAAERMKLDWEKYYEILTTTLVDWCDIGEEDGQQFYSLHRAPVIRLEWNVKILLLVSIVKNLLIFFNISV